MSKSSSVWRDVAVVVAAKAALGGLALAGGFRAVSDDDFARVVIAQRWAAAPALDPTGTSWLPLPFWIYGTALRLFGSPLFVARATAVVLGLLSAALLYATARLLLNDRRQALWGTLVACALPWSMRLGVATVPELPTAALALFGAATLTNDGLRTRMLGAIAISAACLSRYEPWPLAFAFAVLCTFDARRIRRPTWLAPGAVVLVGAAAWLSHNALVHGSPLHFATRVSAYWKAVGGDAQSALLGYPLSLLREEPELCLVALALFIGARLRDRPLAPSAARIGGLMVWLLFALTLAALPGGAPTHHAGRALLVIWLAASIYVGAAAHGVMTSRAEGERLALAALVAAVMPLGVLVLRPWYARLDDFSPRRDETAIGRLAIEHAPGDAPLLLEIVDYGYYAVLAGSGEPSRFVLDRGIDPRSTVGESSFIDAKHLASRLERAGAGCVVARPSAATATLGAAAAAAGRWRVWCR